MAKKLLAITICLALFLGISGCGSNDGSNKVYKIGVLQLVQHDALDKANEGFMKALEDNGFKDGENIEVDYQNAAGDQSNCQTISDSFINDGKDLILAIGTPAAQAVANKTKDIPILVTAVTDPADAGLVKSNEKPETNVSGTSDLTPVEEQIDLLKQIVPDAKTVGVMYCSNESNSILQAGIAKKAIEAKGMTYVEGTVSNSNEIQQVASSLVDKADVLYVPTDNMVSAGIATVAMVANEKNVPIICGESGMLEGGALATYGIDYYNLGYKTGLQAVKILKGEAKVEDMPIEYLAEEDLEMAVNEEAAKTLGITIPDSIMSQIKK
ncbi:MULTISPECIES: ABC transporter substrate-binding protein [Anaerofustis]|uniref:ABC transporter substrate-binding protein n=1 Tax=Anaerofustis TaxID=264995 RepID=UPI001106F6C7|nr:MULTISPECIES: ABC transporter substrate-binding protein [Anaerofustis]MCO8193180.1 ABC transporter substrate-binding protein [Anaerofustis sp. NSJ-163]